MLHRLYVSARRLRKRAGALEFRGCAQPAVVGDAHRPRAGAARHHGRRRV